MKRMLLGLFDRINLFPLFNRFTRNRAAVFMLHHFCGPGERDFRSVQADRLDRCLNYVVKHGYRTLSLSGYVDALVRRQSLNKAIVFTVDDGYRDFLLHGFPVFDKYDIPVAVFITTGFIDGEFSFWWDDVRRMLYRTKQTRIELTINGSLIEGDSTSDDEREVLLHRIVEQAKKLPREQIDRLVIELGRQCHYETTQMEREALTWGEIFELAAKGVEFYPHTCTHPILSRCSDAQVEKEIFASKETLSAQLKTSSNIFCYPNGRHEDFDHRSIDALKRAGYIAAFTSEEGFDTTIESPHMFKLHRFALFNDILRFKQIISGLEAMRTTIR